MAPRVQPGNPQWVDIVDAKARKLEDLGSKSFQTYKRVRTLSATAFHKLLLCGTREFAN